MGAVLTKLLEVFWTKKLDIVVIGLENRFVIPVIKNKWNEGMTPNHLLLWSSDVMPIL